MLHLLDCNPEIFKSFYVVVALEIFAVVHVLFLRIKIAKKERKQSNKNPFVQNLLAHLANKIGIRRFFESNKQCQWFCGIFWCFAISIWSDQIDGWMNELSYMVLLILAQQHQHIPSDGRMHTNIIFHHHMATNSAFIKDER